jgi:hypothetical protein
MSEENQFQCFLHQQEGGIIRRQNFSQGENEDKILVKERICGRKEKLDTESP